MKVLRQWTYLLTLGIMIPASTIFAQDVEIRDEPKKKDDKKGPRVERPQLNKDYVVTNKYVHKWVKFPSFAGELLTGSRLEIKPHRGQAEVVIFLASWCRPCQMLINEFKSLEERYSKLHTRFTYVFAHDTRQDAEAFSKHTKLSGHNTLLANPKLLRQFKQPELPSIYVADRTRWLVARYVPVKRDDLAELDDFLRGTNTM